MGKASGKKKRDDDVLRAGDIVPPYGDDAGAEVRPRKRKSARKKASTPQRAGKKRTKRKTTKSPAAEQQGDNIPQLDLDKQILAGQRKVTSVRRKGPGSKRKPAAKAPEAKGVGGRIWRPALQIAEREQIIAEIVAKDIEKLCRG